MSGQKVRRDKSGKVIPGKQIDIRINETVKISDGGFPFEAFKKHIVTKMSDYFNKVPNFEYVSRLPNAKIGDYVTVKNLFKKGALQEDILNNLALHTKYRNKGIS